MLKEFQLLVITVTLLCHGSEIKGENHYINKWAAQIEGGLDQATRIAKRHGYSLVEAIPHLDDFYVLLRDDVPTRSKRSAHHHTRRLTEDSEVIWAEQQVSKSRVKREVKASYIRSDGTVGFNDPMYNSQWYLHGKQDEHQVRRQGPIKNMAIEEAWKAGATGKGVVLSVLDDGIEHNHTDLAQNYDPFASGDLNDNDDDPFPRYDITNENKHGTRCAGEIAMIANNGVCGVGVAFKSRIGGVRILDGKVTDEIEARSLTYNLSHIDIYSASWGPNDDGNTLEGPGKLASLALQKGVTQGRQGKGAIYMWASGNGGRMRDNCNCDGYTSSIYTLSVSSASEHGIKPWYSERCASTFTSAYSSGNMADHSVVSADLHNLCTTQHTGTSAAAPIAAGIVALALEKNPSLTWRDVQHLVAWTSNMGPLETESGWFQNAAGFCVNPAFGFGLMDAFKLVVTADPETWVNVPPQVTCTVNANNASNLPQNLNSGHFIEVQIQTNGCEDTPNEVNYIEHIEVVFSLSYTKRGDIGASLVSPSGTETVLMEPREYDRSSEGFDEWPLMAVHFWGEKPEGTWRFRVYDKTDNKNHGVLTNVSLVIHGTKEIPNHMKNGPKKCDVEMKAYEKNMQEKPKENEEAQYADTEVKAGLMKTIEDLLASSAINSTLPPAKAREQALIDLLQRVNV